MALVQQPRLIFNPFPDLADPLEGSPVMPKWIWVRDPDTGHCFDLHEKDLRLRNGSVEIVEGYPENSGDTAQPRPPKHNLQLPRAAAQAAPQAGAEATEESEQPAKPERKPESPQAGTKATAKTPRQETKE